MDVPFVTLQKSIYLCKMLGYKQKTNNLMKRLFTLITLGVVMLFAACDTENEGGALKHFGITSETTITVDADGGNVAITYTIKDAIEGEKVETAVVSGQEMINSVTSPAQGVIIVDVKANSGAQRVAVIAVSYGKEAANITIQQKGSGNGGGNNGDNGGSTVADVEFTASFINGYYYGEKYGEGTDRYAFFLSDQGLNNGGQAYTNGTYYYIDCFSPANKSLTLPLGTYNFDKSNTGSAYTINSENSQLILTGDSVESTVSTVMTNAKMVVSANKIVLEATIDGKLHKVTFFGSLELEDVSGENPDNGGDDSGDKTEGQDGEAQSTLTEDRHVTFDGEHRAKWGYEGDYWQTGYSNYTIYIMNKSAGYVYGDTLQFDLITDNTSTDGKFAGKYTISDKPGKLIMMAGFTNKYAQAVGSWLYEYGGSSASGYKNYAMIKSGTAEFIDNGNGTHTVILNGQDYKGNKITCNWTGVIEED